MSSKTVVAVAVAAAAAAEAIQHSRRLSSSDNKNDWSPFQSEKEFNWNIAIALIVLVCFVLGAIGLNAIIKCVYGPLDEPSSPPPPPPSAYTARQKLSQMCMGPTQTFTHELVLAGADHPECAICISEFVEGDPMRILPKCNHRFHDKCIESWLINRNSCPTCRRSCLKTASDNIEAANPPETEIVVQQQQQQQQLNDIDDIEAANPPESEIQPQHDIDIEEEAGNLAVTEIVVQQHK